MNKKHMTINLVMIPDWRQSDIVKDGYTRRWSNIATLSVLTAKKRTAIAIAAQRFVISRPFGIFRPHQNLILG
jgi:hypothetical protein